MPRIARLLTIVSAMVAWATFAPAAEPQAGAPAARAEQAKAGPPMFVAVGYALRRMTSRDGLTWLDEQAAPEHGQDKEFLLRGVAYGQGKIVAVGGSRTSETSDDGIEWQRRTLPEGAGSLTDLVWTGREFLASGGRTAFHSADGVEWKKSDARMPSRTCYGGGRFVGFSVGRFSTSTDARAWTPVDTVHRLQVTKIIHVPAP